MRFIKIKLFLPILAVMVQSGCNKSPYLPNNPATFVELINNSNEYGKDNDNEPLMSTIRVMTYNIHAGVAPANPGVVSLEAIASVINAEQPDIVFLQEVDKNTGRNDYSKDMSVELGALTQMNASFFSATNVGSGFYGTAILSKYPLSNIRKQLLPKGNASEEQRVVGMAQVDLPGKDSMVAMVTHLQHNSDASRLLQVREIANVANTIDLPMVMGGDLNEKPTATGFFEVFDGVFTRTCTGGCPNTFPASNATSIIDYLAYKPAARFSVNNHKAVIATHASDHLPVVSELKINR